MIEALILFAADAPRWNCADPQAQQEMNWCAGEDFRRADAALNRQWTKTVAAMKQRDRSEFEPDDGRPGNFRMLLDGQRAWLKFRDAQCTLEGYAFRGGTMEPFIVATCKTALTQARTKQLQELIDQ